MGCGASGEKPAEAKEAAKEEVQEARCCIRVAVPLIGTDRLMFPRAFERRVLRIMGVCHTSSRLDLTSTYISFISSTLKFNLRIFTSSHLQIFTHLLSVSLSPSCPLSRSLSFFSFLSQGSRLRAVPTGRHEMEPPSHEMRFDCQKLK